MPNDSEEFTSHSPEYDQLIEAIVENGVSTLSLETIEPLSNSGLFGFMSDEQNEKWALGAREASLQGDDRKVLYFTTRLVLHNLRLLSKAMWKKMAPEMKARNPVCEDAFQEGLQWLYTGIPRWDPNGGSKISSWMHMYFCKGLYEVRGRHRSKGLKSQDATSLNAIKKRSKEIGPYSTLEEQHELLFRKAVGSLFDIVAQTGIEGKAYRSLTWVEILRLRDRFRVEHQRSPGSGDQTAAEDLADLILSSRPWMSRLALEKVSTAQIGALGWDAALWKHADLRQKQMELEREERAAELLPAMVEKHGAKQGHALAREQAEREIDLESVRVPVRALYEYLLTDAAQDLAARSGQDLAMVLKELRKEGVLMETKGKNHEKRLRIDTFERLLEHDLNPLSLESSSNPNDDRGRSPLDRLATDETRVDERLEMEEFRRILDAELAHAPAHNALARMDSVHLARIMARLSHDELSERPPLGANGYEIAAMIGGVKQTVDSREADIFMALRGQVPHPNDPKRKVIVDPDRHRKFEEFRQDL